MKSRDKVVLRYPPPRKSVNSGLCPGSLSPGPHQNGKAGLWDGKPFLVQLPTLVSLRSLTRRSSIDHCLYGLRYSHFQSKQPVVNNYDTSRRSTSSGGGGGWQEYLLSAGQVVETRLIGPVAYLSLASNADLPT